MTSASVARQRVEGFNPSTVIGLLEVEDRVSFDFRPAGGDWLSWTGTVVATGSAVPTGHVAILYDKECFGCTAATQLFPFRGGEVEYVNFDVKRWHLNVEQIAWQPPEQQTIAGSSPKGHSHHSSLATEVAQALLDMETGYVTAAVPNGDGLRQPAVIPQLWRVLYPSLWFSPLRRRGDEGADLEAKWRRGITDLQQYLCAFFSVPSQRDAFLLHVENVVVGIHRPTLPVSKEAWRAPFKNAALLLREMINVTLGHEAAETFDHRFEKAWIAGLINFEELYRIATKEEEAPPSSVTALNSRVQCLEDHFHAIVQEQMQLMRRQEGGFAVRQEVGFAQRRHHQRGTKKGFNREPKAARR